MLPMASMTRTTSIADEPTIRTMDRTRLHRWRQGHRPAGTLHACPRRKSLQSRPQGHIRLAQSRRKHQRSPSQPSCESSSCWQTPCFETIENGCQNPLDQNGYSSFGRIHPLRGSDRQAFRRRANIRARGTQRGGRGEFGRRVRACRKSDQAGLGLGFGG